MLATQTLTQKKAKNMRVTVDGKLPPGVTAKDIILAIIGEIGTAGGTGHVIEYGGEAIRALSMEGRMTVATCRSRAAPAPAWSRPTRRPSPTSRAGRSRPRARPGTRPCSYWQTLQSDEGAHFDREVSSTPPSCRRS